MKIKSSKTFYFREKLILKNEIIEVVNDSDVRFLIDKHKCFAVSDSQPATQTIK